MLVTETQAKTSATIEGSLVRLAPLDEENIYRHFEWSNDPDLNRMHSELPFEEEPFGDFKRRFESLIESPPAHERHFEIATLEGAMIGIAYIGRISPHNRNCVVSITIGDREFRGKGYGRDAMALLMRFCFDELGMHRVTAETFEYNDVWRELVEAMGFQREGNEREHLFRDGRFWDKATYGLLEPEYRATTTGQS
jgi:RimJ/RimL family protein N-acetyltransferase